MEQTEPVTQSPSPAPAPVSPPPLEPNEKTSWGAVIGLIVVVVASALAAFYFLKERVGDGIVTQESQVEALQEQGTSTEPSAIESDLEAQSPDEFDQELEDAFVELDASLEGEAQ